MDLNALHPFREGNGRTIRFYLQLLANNAGYLLDYNEVGREEIPEKIGGFLHAGTWT